MVLPFLVNDYFAVGFMLARTPAIWLSNLNDRQSQATPANRYQRPRQRSH
jgi:hypothetical protein